MLYKKTHYTIVQLKTHHSFKAISQSTYSHVIVLFKEIILVLHTSNLNQIFHSLSNVCPNIFFNN